MDQCSTAPHPTSCPTPTDQQGHALAVALQGPGQASAALLAAGISLAHPADPVPLGHAPGQGASRRRATRDRRPWGHRLRATAQRTIARDSPDPAPRRRQPQVPRPAAVALSAAANAPPCRWSRIPQAVGEAGSGVHRRVGKAHCLNPKPLVDSAVVMRIRVGRGQQVPERDSGRSRTRPRAADQSRCRLHQQPGIVVDPIFGCSTGGASQGLGIEASRPGRRGLPAEDGRRGRPPAGPALRV
jgi:hypothetical protein